MRNLRSGNLEMLSVIRRDEKGGMNVFTIIQSPHKVGKHAQQIAEAHGREEQRQVEEKEFTSFGL